MYRRARKDVPVFFVRVVCNFIFQDVEYMFQVVEYMFQDLKYRLQGVGWKFKR